MSLTPRNIILDGPDVMSKVLFIGIDPLSSSGEGSPIYTTIDAQVAVSGTYSAGGYDFAFSGTTAIAQRVRVAMRPSVGDVDLAGENYEIERDHAESSWIDFGYIADEPSDDTVFIAAQSSILGCNGGSPPFAPPGFFLSPQIEEYIEGTRTDPDPDPPVVVARFMQLRLWPPGFLGSIQNGDLKMVVRLNVSVNHGAAEVYTASFPIEIDASAWGTPDFRDIRGTYGETSTDVNGLEYIWSITLA